MSLYTDQSNLIFIRLSSIYISPWNPTMIHRYSILHSSHNSIFNWSSEHQLPLNSHLNMKFHIRYSSSDSLQFSIHHEIKHLPFLILIHRSTISLQFILFSTLPSSSHHTEHSRITSHPFSIPQWIHQTSSFILNWTSTMSTSSIPQCNSINSHLTQQQFKLHHFHQSMKFNSSSSSPQSSTKDTSTFTLSSLTKVTLQARWLE